MVGEGLYASHGSVNKELTAQTQPDPFPKSLHLRSWAQWHTLAISMLRLWRGADPWGLEALNNPVSEKQDGWHPGALHANTTSNRGELAQQLVLAALAEGQNSQSPARNGSSWPHYLCFLPVLTPFWLHGTRSMDGKAHTLQTSKIAKHLNH